MNVYVYLEKYIVQELNKDNNILRKPYIFIKASFTYQSYEKLLSWKD